MTNSHPKQVTPTNGYAEATEERRRLLAQHLTPGEVEPLMEATRGNRHGHRDATMMLMAYRHGLRAPQMMSTRVQQEHHCLVTRQERH